MVNEEHLALLKQGVAVWNEWREKNLGVEINLSGASLTKANLKMVNLRGAKLVGTDFSGANLIGADLREADLREADLSEATLASATLRKANLSESNLSESHLSGANLSKTNLSLADLSWANIDSANLTEADLSEADLCQTQALSTDFKGAILTGVSIQDWNINYTTNLDGVSCEYVYLKRGQEERFPIDRNFSPREFTKLFQKASSIIELIFHNGVDWIAFSYSFGKLKIENEEAELAVQSIESKGDGIVVVKVSISQDTNKEILHKKFIQGYEFTQKLLKEKYRAELSSKDAQISHTQENQSQKEVINNLFNLLQQLIEVQKLMIENPRKIYKYDLRHSQLAGGIANAEIIHTKQIGGDIHNNDKQEH